MKTNHGKNLHNHELHNLYYSLNIVTVIKLRRNGWAGHVARIEEGRNVNRVLVRRPEGKTGFCFGGPKVRDHWEDLGVGGRIILRWTLGR
jgi:hypothetical protein